MTVSQLFPALVDAEEIYEEPIENEIDPQWIAIASDILENGMDQKPQNVRAKYKTDKSPAVARYVIGRTMSFSGKYVPIQQSKLIRPKKPVQELILWMWQQKSNRIEDLHKYDCKIWDEWVFPQGHKHEGTIGPAYGFVLGIKCRKYPVSKLKWHHLDQSKEMPKIHTAEDGSKYVMLDQVDYLIQELLNNPTSRRLVISIWDLMLLDEMYLEPCVWSTEWFVDEEKYLHVIVNARSQDFCLGTPFNTTQYYILQARLAQVAGLKVGSMLYVMGNTHIYDRHFDGAKQIIEGNYNKKGVTLKLNPHVTNFYEFTDDDFELVGYEPGPNIKFEIAE